MFSKTSKGELLKMHNIREPTQDAKFLLELINHTSSRIVVNNKRLNRIAKARLQICKLEVCCLQKVAFRQVLPTLISSKNKINQINTKEKSILFENVYFWSNFVKLPRSRNIKRIGGLRRQRKSTQKCRSCLISKQKKLKLKVFGGLERDR